MSRPEPLVLELPRDQPNLSRLLEIRQNPIDGKDLFAKTTIVARREIVITPGRVLSQNLDCFYKQFKHAEPERLLRLKVTSTGSLVSSPY